MSALIEWSNRMPTTQPRITGRLPRKPTHFFGEIYLQLPGGERDVRAWRSNQKMTTTQARTVLEQLLNSLIGEHGRDQAISSGFWVRSR